MGEGLGNSWVAPTALKNEEGEYEVRQEKEMCIEAWFILILP